MGPERSVEIEGHLYDPASFGCCCRCGGVPINKSRQEEAEEKYRLEQKKDLQRQDVSTSNDNGNDDERAVELTEVAVAPGTTVQRSTHVA